MDLSLAFPKQLYWQAEVEWLELWIKHSFTLLHSAVFSCGRARTKLIGLQDNLRWMTRCQFPSAAQKRWQVTRIKRLMRNHWGREMYCEYFSFFFSSSNCLFRPFQTEDRLSSAGMSFLTHGCCQHSTSSIYFFNLLCFSLSEVN